MATLTALTVGDSAAPNEWTSAVNGVLGDNSDGTLAWHDENDTVTVEQGWELGNVDADLGNMDTLFCILRYAQSATDADKTFDTLAARIMDGATVLAAATSGGAFETIASTITTTTPTNSSSVEFTYVNTSATKANWDAAIVEIQIAQTRLKGGGTQEFEVYEADFTGTYTLGPPQITDVETDEDFRDKDTALTITGLTFEAVQGTGKVEISDNAVYATGTKIAQTVTSWADTAIDFTAVLSTLAPGPLWLWITNDTGDRNTTGFVVTVHRAIAITLSLSGNITASGEDTTFQLAAPAGKATTDFVAGRIQDDENPADTVDVTADDYSEWEWSIEATTDAPDSTQYEFRILAGTDLLDTYTVTPKWTIAASGGAQTLTGALFTSGNTFPTGVIAGPLTGVLFSSTNTFPTGQIDLTIAGVLFTSTNTFPTGQINLTLNGVLFSSTSTFPAGQLNLTINGVLFSSTNTFPAGAVQPGGVTLTGVLFSSTNTFPAGSVNIAIVGGLFTSGNTFSVGVIAGPLTGVLFTSTNTFPVGQLNQTINGVLFTSTNTFAAGQVNLTILYLPPRRQLTTVRM